MYDDEISLPSNSDKHETPRQYDMLLGKHMEHYSFETTALHRKLQSKVEAVRILRKELEKFRIERDQFKLMAETLQLRYSAIKRQSDLCGSKTSVANLLHETRERNIKLTTEVEALKQKLAELQGDIKLLRQREPKTERRRTSSDLIVDKLDAETLQWKHERANFISHLEHLKKKNAQQSYDLKALIDEKEELITERDAYKCKAHRLNHELFVALKANETHPKFLDIDGIILENKYLYERINNLENELDLKTQALQKYKSMLDSKRKKGIIKLGSSSNDESILSHKQVKCMLENGIDLPTKTETIQDLRSLCMALLDNLNDKSLALSHQRKANKMLASKIGELEQRLQQLVGYESSSTCNSGYAPTLYMLNGYSAAQVDIDDNNDTTLTTTPPARGEGLKIICHQPKELTGTISTELDESNQVSDDGMSSLSTESGRSVLSSVYGIDVANDEDLTINAAIFQSNASNDSAETAYETAPRRPHVVVPGKEISHAVAQARLDDLKDLPPELAAMVQQALHELDLRDFDSYVVSDKEIMLARELGSSRPSIVAAAADED